jgi:hypothetical protein
VQSFSPAREVKPGDKASFVIWVWSLNATSKRVSVKARVVHAAYVGAPYFSVCPVAGGRTCKLGNLPVGQADELEVTVNVQAKAALGEQVQITAHAFAAKALPYSASAADEVMQTTTSSPTGPLVTLPVPGGPPVPGALPAPGVLPAIPGTSISPTEPSGLFPTVGASPAPGTGSLGLPPAQPRAVLHTANVADAVPLDARLIGGQLVGLAALAGALTIAILRLSLRKPKENADSGARRSPPE